jgi:hypothetical protein
MKSTSQAAPDVPVDGDQNAFIQRLREQAVPAAYLDEPLSRTISSPWSMLILQRGKGQERVVAGDQGNI